MKLMALRGVLEHQLDLEPASASEVLTLSADSRRIMELMDSLL